MNIWIIFWFDICHFWWKVPFFVYFGQFSGTLPIRPVSKSPWLLNWIIFWIESAEFSLNWIIFWIESWVKRYWIKYWMSHFLAKFKHWIESDGVSNTPNAIARKLSQVCNVKLSISTWWRQYVWNVTGKGFGCHPYIEDVDNPPIKSAWDVQRVILPLSFYHCRCSSSQKSNHIFVIFLSRNVLLGSIFLHMKALKLWENKQNSVNNRFSNKT